MHDRVPSPLRAPRIAWILAAVLAGALLGACARPSAVGTLRFRNQPPVWRVNDRVDTPKKPQERWFAHYLYQLDGYLMHPITRPMAVRGHRRAANINALGEVPDSTWFSNRIGVRDPSVDQVRRGPNQDEGPEAHKPWTILSTKVGGTAVGFLVEDSRGARFLLKFDPKGYPEREIGAHIIVHRLLWACGYNVPEDHLVHLTRDDLVLAEDAVVKDKFGNERPMTAQDLDRDLSRAAHTPGEPMRALASMFIPGIPIGGYGRTGVREDDPNDLVPHQMRRDLRGLYAIAAWLGHTDMKEDNTLDAWVEDPRVPGKHYVRHYLIDFGKALGVMSKGVKGLRMTSGFAYKSDPAFGVLSLLSLGLWKRPWEDLSAPDIPGLGLFESTLYDPATWHSEYPYTPFHEADRFDAFWGAKILIRFTPEHIRAAVDEARYSDARAAPYMTRILIERQRKTARYWFGRVNPLDGFVVRGTPDAQALCFDDLLLVHGLEDQGRRARYRATAFDHGGQATGWRGAAEADPGGRACLTGVAPGPDHDGYVILRLLTYRDQHGLPPVDVHLARDPATGRLRVIGIRRH